MSESHFIRLFKATFGETPSEFRRRGPLPDAPSPKPYGIDFGIRDPFGNAIRIGQMF